MGADDEPKVGPEWWKVRCLKPMDLAGCQIRWPFAGMKYRYKVEGSVRPEILVDAQPPDSALFANPRKSTILIFDHARWRSLRENYGDGF